MADRFFPELAFDDAHMMSFVITNTTGANQPLITRDPLIDALTESQLLVPT